MSGLPDAGRVLDLPVAIRRDDVLHFLGYPEGQQPGERIERLMADAMREAKRFISPRGVFVRHSVSRSREIGLEPLDATELVVGLVTVGGELERHVDDLLSVGAPTRALLLDAAGSAAAEEAADALGAMIAADGLEAGVERPAPHVSCRVSPGYGSWPIRAQEALFEVLPHRRLGVALLPTMLMTPRKSISFAMWLGADRRPLAGLSGCARCGLVECRYRRAGVPEGV